MTRSSTRRRSAHEYIASPVCLRGLVTACRLVTRNLAAVVLILLLLMTVHLTRTYYKSATEAPSQANRTIRNKSWATAAVIEVDVDGNFTDRVTRFNVELHHVRRRLSLTSPENDVNRTICSISDGDNQTANTGLGGIIQPRVVWGMKVNYIDELADNPDIVTVALPWLRSRSNWNSMTDFSNVFYQRYYEWTGDNVLCTWIETPKIIKMRYDSIYRRTCNRNIKDTTRARSLRPVFLNARPLWRDEYWPNDGDSYPKHFYASPPPYVFYVHIHRNAVVTQWGDVFTARTKLVLYACSHDLNPALPHGGKLSQIACYDEVYLITQYWGNSVFHRMAEIMPRLALSLQFLNAHPEIRILGPQVGGRLGELLDIIGLDKSRLVTGVTRANIVYQPRATGCGFANVQESQVVSQLYRDYIRRTFTPQPRNRLILIRRSGHRRFTEQQKVEEALERAAKDYNLIYTLFIDNPTPSLNDTMMMFHSAVIIVAPHGGGLANMYFSQPGTYVVEGVCNLPHVNLCFQRMAHILGHHWHGVTSRRGCEGVVDVSATSIEDAVRSYLRLWMLERSL